MSASSVPDNISDDDLRAEFAACLPDLALPPILPHTRSVLIDKIRKVKKERRAGNADPAAAKLRGCDGPLRAVLKAVHKIPKPSPVANMTKDDENEVANYVFLDLEATALGSANPRTRITELSLVAVTKGHFETLRRGLRQLEFKADPETLTPRVLNKLTLCFSPQAQVSPTAAALTGLDNNSLEEQAQFNSGAVDQIKCFLRSLRRPICLVAHNGKKFDFPLLLAEVLGCGGTIEEDGLTCMDSLPVLKSIYEKEKKVIDAEIAAVEEMSALGAFDDDDDDDFGEDMGGVSRLHWDDSGGEESQYHSALSSPTTANADDCNYQLPNTPPKSDPFEHGVLSPPVVHSFQSAPGALQTGPAFAGAAGPGSDGDEEVTPERPIVAAAAPPPLSPKAKKRPKLKRQKQRATTAAKSAKKRLDFDTPASFSLPRLHEHLFGRAPAISHGAEADCLALMRVCARKGVRATTTNSPDRSFKLRAVKPMW